MFSHTTTAQKIIKKMPSGIFLSNGPGDPKATFDKIKNNLDIIKKLTIPIFGICLGHQILSILFGAKTRKNAPWTQGSKSSCKKS